jgi:UDP-N-acetylmuramoylalanine--D-glutamate ligase
MNGNHDLSEVTRALVLGLGRFGGGREAARYLARRGVPLRIADGATADSLAESVEALAGLDIEWRLGEQGPGVLDGVDLLVVNPAIPDAHPVLAEARRRGIRTTQEVELFLRAYPGRVVLVTGTNGKSTATTMLGRALSRAGLDALCGGNIGRSLLADEALWSPQQIAVLEISSFQLERLDPERTRVSGAVYTPVTRDHLDRHGSLEAYHQAKAVAAGVAADFVVHGADDPVAAAFPTSARQRLIHRDGPRQPGDAAWRDGDLLVLGGTADPGPLLRPAALRLLGAFQAGHAMATALAAVACGARRAEAALAIVGQEPLPYRLQLAAVRGGVRVYDNSVSTALESTVSALESLTGPIHWVGGGKSKEGPEGYVRFAAAVAGRIASAQLFGAAADAMAAELRRAGASRVGAHASLEAAMAAAAASARPGEAVLFSPGFASFDQFPNFRARAETFRTWLRGGAGAG